MTGPGAAAPQARYTYGGDEWIWVELEEAMSIRANMRALAITRRLAEEAIDGLVDICPGNASYLVRLDPDQLDPRAAMERLRQIEGEVGDARGFDLVTRIVEIPVLFGDEWTHATLMRFRDRHQTPDRTDIEFAAEINGYASPEALIEAMCGTPFIAGMIGFVPGLPWCYQLVGPDRQIEVPKYVRPRTDTPERAFGWGGAFAAIYPVRGAGGYQLFGLCPGPIVDPSQRLPDFRDSYVLLRAGDLVSFVPVDRPDFDRIRGLVEENRYRYRMADVEFVPERWYADPDGATAELRRAIDGA
jgi:urea carboxylase